MDKKIKCARCLKFFVLSDGEQQFYEELGYRLPKRCKTCRAIVKQERESEGKITSPEVDYGQPRSTAKEQEADRLFIDTEAIVDFVNTIEEAKGYVKDPRLIFAHLVEEIGELSRALWLFESGKAKSTLIIKELIDIIFLACYIADILHANLNDEIPDRMEQISEQYLKEPAR